MDDTHENENKNEEHRGTKKYYKTQRLQKKESCIFFSFNSII